MNGFRLAMSFFLPTISQWIRLKTTDSKYEEIMMTLVKQIVEDREKTNTEHKDFMQLLMQLRNSGQINEEDDWTFKTSTGWYEFESGYENI